MTVQMWAQFFASLSILIILHECGHFFPARWFKTRVEKFYLFFDPWFSIYKKKIGDTEYGIGWLPLGGYVKISGMVDESMDTEQLKNEPQPWEFRSKKPWQRLIIMIGGVTVNLILGVIIFIGITWHYGDDYLESSKHQIQVDSLGKKLGFQTGDKVLKIEGKNFDKLSSGLLKKEIVINSAKKVEVERNGVATVIDLPSNVVELLTEYKNQKSDIFDPRIPFIINTFSDGSGAKKANMQEGDRVISINDKPANYYDELRELTPQYKGQTVKVAALRGKDTMMFDVTLDTAGRLGAFPITEYKKLFPSIIHQSYGFGEAVVLGTSRAIENLGIQVKAFGKIFSGEIKAKDSVGGFTSIAKSFDKEWNWRTFWERTGLLSLILAFMNLLPIPALDGGYVMFLLWEIVTGKKVSDAFMEKAVTAGFLLLMSMILLVNGWEIIRGIIN